MEWWLIIRSLLPQWCPSSFNEWNRTTQQRQNYCGSVRSSLLRRVHFVPFGVTFTGKQINKRLVEELLEEEEGILAWLVGGCIAWYRNGRLTVPVIVQAATEAYREEMDGVARFLSDECVLSPEKKVGATQLLGRYEA